MTLHDWLRTIAFALSDDQPGRPFQRYPVKDLLAAYNDAICLIASRRPDLFTELRIVHLTAGRHQDVRGCCVNVLGVLEQTDEAGNILRTIDGSRKTSTTVKRNWKKPSCLPRPENGYLVSTADIDPNLNGRFTVEPPVPCGVDAYVRIKCVEAPCALDETMVNMTFDGNCTMNSAAWHYVLARMLSGDNFEGSSQTTAQYHYRMFFDVLGIQYEAEKLIESPEEA